MVGRLLVRRRGLRRLGVANLHLDLPLLALARLTIALAVEDRQKRHDLLCEAKEKGSAIAKTILARMRAAGATT